MNEEIRQIRDKLTAIGQYSHTSIQFQDDLLNFIAQNRGKGDSIIEVGCYFGGLTAQLAWYARELGIILHVIDINKDYLQMAANAVDQFSLTDHVRFQLMDLTQFAAETRNNPTPLVVFIDGDHLYDGVVADIRAIRSLAKPPFAVAFHDYSLRMADGDLIDVRVDKAIRDELGADVPMQPIGEIAGVGRTLRTEPKEDRHFHEIGQPEGVLILLDRVGSLAN